MTSIYDDSTYAELSLAAYANLDLGPPNAAALKVAGFSDIQAQVFRSIYRVVEIHTESNSLSATVFERIDETGEGTGEKCLAIREIGDRGQTTF